MSMRINQISTVRLHYCNIQRTICLDESISLEEFQSLLQQSFGSSCYFVGCIDKQSNIYYPLTFLLSSSAKILGASESLYLIADGDDPSDVDDFNPSVGYSAKQTEVQQNNNYILGLEDAIHAAQYLTGLEELDVQSVFTQFSQQKAYNNQMTKKEYLNCFLSILEILPPNRLKNAPQKSTRMADFFSMLFDVYCSRGSHTIALTDVASICTVLCKGDDSENRAVVFELYDINNDGYILENDLYRHLLAVYLLLFQLSEEAALMVHSSAEEFASRTTVEVMDIIERERADDKLLSYEEFDLACEYVVKTGYNGLIDKPGVFNGKNKVSSHSDDGLEDANDDEDDGAIDDHDNDEVRDAIRRMRLTARNLDEENEVDQYIAKTRNSARSGDDGNDDDDDNDVDGNKTNDEGSENADDETKSSVSGNVSVLYDDSAHHPVNISEARRVMSLTKLTAKYVIHFMADLSDKSGFISNSKYLQGMEKLIGRQYTRMSSRDRAAADFTMNKLFSLFDSHCSGFCDAVELCTGLVLYCGGSHREKGEAVIALLARFSRLRQIENPVDGLEAGYVMMAISSLFQVAQTLDAYFLVGKTPTACARSIAYEFFPDCIDTNCIDILTATDCFSEIFLRFFQVQKDDSPRGKLDPSLKLSPDRVDYQCMSARSPPTLASVRKQHSYSESSPYSTDFGTPMDKGTSHSSGSETPVNSDLEKSDVVQELRGARDALGFTELAAEDLMEKLGDYSSEGMISRLSFLHVMKQIAKVRDINEEVAEALASEIFSQFDSAETDSVEYADLAAGLAVLCDSPFEIKAMVAFIVVDSNTDGFITTSELQQLVLSVLNVVYTCSPTAVDKITKCGITLEAIARAVAAEAARAGNRSSGKSVSPMKQVFSMALFSQIAGDCIALADAVTKDR